MVPSKAIICVFSLSLILALASSLHADTDQSVIADDVQATGVYSIEATGVTGGAAGAMVVPEPATIALLGMSSLVLIRTRRDG